MARLPFNISNQSLTFYIKGRPYSLTKDHGNYAKARELLQAPGDHDAEHLVALVDVRQALLRESQGRIVMDGSDIIFQGHALHNLWVDKVLEFRDAGEDFSPIWNALDKLVHNPTPEAIERLPIFLERSGLGFLPDGRFVAFKGVQADLKSFHVSPDGSYFTHEIGAKPRMERSAVDADPNRTCSYGLHVGTPAYVKEHYSHGAVVLVAVDPVDVVAVPTDYNGSKMRVCGYEVIDHLEKEYSDELMGRLRTTVTGYSPAVDEIDEREDGDIEPEENGEDIEEAAYFPLPGDLVQVTGDGFPPAGVYPVLASYLSSVTIQTLHDGVQTVSEDRFGEITPRPWMRATIGGSVDLRATGQVGAAYRNGGKRIEVTALMVDGPNDYRPQVQVRTRAGLFWVDGHRVTEAYDRA